jgi:hypothetical protein
MKQYCLIKNNVLTCSFKLLHTIAQCDDTIGIVNPTGLLRAKSPRNDLKAQACMLTFQ